MTGSNGILQAVTIHNSLSTPACTCVDIFAIVYIPIDRVDGCTVCFFYSVLFEMTFIPRPEENFVFLIRHFTHYEWPFEMFTEIFGLLKINESTGTDKDEEVQRKTAEVYSENLRNTKPCHSSSTKVPASLWNQGWKKKVALYSKRP